MTDSTKIRQAAFLISQSVCAMIEAMGMAAANSQYPEDQPYTMASFENLLETYGIHHNAAIKTLNGD